MTPGQNRWCGSWDLIWSLRTSQGAFTRSLKKWDESHRKNGDRLTLGITSSSPTSAEEPWATFTTSPEKSRISRYEKIKTTPEWGQNNGFENNIYIYFFSDPIQTSFTTLLRTYQVNVAHAERDGQFLLKIRHKHMLGFHFLQWSKITSYERRLYNELLFSKNSLNQKEVQTAAQQREKRLAAFGWGGKISSDRHDVESLKYFLNGF